MAGNLALLDNDLPLRPRLAFDRSVPVPWVVVLFNGAAIAAAVDAAVDAVQDAVEALKGDVAVDLDTLGKIAQALGGKATPAQVAAAALTQTTQEVAGPPNDLPPGTQRLVWNTAKNAPSFWMNRGGTLIDILDPGTF